MRGWPAPPGAGSPFPDCHPLFPAQFGLDVLIEPRDVRAVVSVVDARRVVDGRGRGESSSDRCSKLFAESRFPLLPEPFSQLLLNPFPKWFLRYRCA